MMSIPSKMINPPWPALLATVIVMTLLALVPELRAQDELAETFSQQDAIELRIKEARAELGQLPDDDLMMHDKLEQLVAICQYHLGAVKIAADTERKKVFAANAAQSWRGFPDPPPYSILAIDKIRLTRASHLATAKASEAQIEISSRALEVGRNKFAELQRKERRFEEKASDATTPEEKIATERAVRMGTIASRIMAEELGRLKMVRKFLRAEVAAIHSEIELADVQLLAAEGKITFTREMLDEVLAGLALKRAEAGRKLVSASDGNRTMDPLLSWKVQFIDLEENFWNQRFAAFLTKDPVIRNSALEVFAEHKTHLASWATLGSLRGSAEITNGSVDPVLLNDARQEVARLQRLVDFSIAELGGEEEGGTSSILDTILGALRSMWEAELYLAKMEEYVDGKMVTTYRAVTPGKLVQLAVILVVGWFLLKLFSRWARNLILRRGKASEATAALSSKWIMGTGLATLVIYGLNRVHIPFTALAFLGGALAIGLGFGTQTLLKNFISGLILIFERPFKVGDLVEVDGITGRIIQIGMRASVVQHFDGIDTLIPNSILLENQVTNWTYSHTKIRHSVTIGVAYGSPPRQVSKILLAAAREHGLVLDDPEPQVRFEDFGDNSLQFRLLFWLEAEKVQRKTLASDLRFIIANAFADAGLVIAFPQRDIHLDSTTPLQVEIQSPSSDRELRPGYPEIAATQREPIKVSDGNSPNRESSS